MMRNRLYFGEITSGGVTARGTFEPLISEELFDKVQDVLKGRVRKREHKHKTELFPLRGFVVCPKCKSKLTAGNVRGRNGKKVGYYFCWQKGCRAVSVRKEILERDWVILLNMMQPNNQYWKRLADSAASSWALDAEQEKKLRSELAAQRAKHLRAIDAKLAGEISAEDFELWKTAAAGEVQRIEDAIKGMESKRDLSKRLMDAPTVNISFSDRWTKASGLDDQQAFQSALFPTGIFWSHENSFFETGNVSLFQSVEALLTDLKRVVGASGFEPPASWSRTTVVRNLSC
jgi:site-specific DNA recombinase